MATQASFRVDFSARFAVGGSCERPGEPGASATGELGDTPVADAPGSPGLPDASSGAGSDRASNISTGRSKTGASGMSCAPGAIGLLTIRTNKVLYSPSPSLPRPARRALAVGGKPCEEPPPSSAIPGAAAGPPLTPPTGPSPSARRTSPGI